MNTKYILHHIILAIIFLSFIGFVIYFLNDLPSKWSFDRQEVSSLVLIDKNSVVGIVAPVVIIPLGSREITAFNTLPEQTDDTPCISASNMDICQTDKLIAASNEFDFGDKLLIDGQVYEIQDRMSLKYQTRIDLLMKSKSSALSFGKQVKEVYILK